MVQAGILVDEDANEDEIYTYRRNLEKYDNNSLTTTILLTWACNLRCIYCFQDHDITAESMSIRMAMRYISFLKNTAISNRTKNMNITLFGGEPLLNMKAGFFILEEMTKFCADNDILFHCGIVTNGTLLTEEVLSKLVSYSCNYFQITLDGVKEIHDTRRIDKNGRGSFDATMKALKLLNPIPGIRKIIRINVDKTNLASTYQLLDYIGKNGLKLTKCTVDFGIVKSNSAACADYAGNCLSPDEIGNVLYDLWKYAEQQGFRYNIKPRQHYLYCGLYRENNYTITPNCEVYKCWEQAGQKEHCMGIIDEFGRFVEQTPAFYHWMNTDPLQSHECKNCAYLPACGGGCGVAKTSDFNKTPSNNCCGDKGKIDKELLIYVNNKMKRQKSIK